MYSTRSGLILGFHGCDQVVADKVINTGEDLYPSNNIYDWLGEGIYFWEQSPDRALHYANELKEHPERSRNPIKNTAVVGAVIDLGFCLDLVNMDNLALIQESYLTIKETYALLDKPLPVNKKGSKDPSAEDLLLRELDCLIINAVHKARAKKREQPFDSVRGVFWEGGDLYPTAGFKIKNHIQIAIRNPNCIKGYFRPKQLNVGHNKV